MLWNYLDPNNRSLFLECRIVSLPANLDFMIFNHRGKAFPVEMDLKLRQWELLDQVSLSLTWGGKCLHWKIKELGCRFWPLVDLWVLQFLLVAWSLALVILAGCCYLSQLIWRSLGLTCYRSYIIRLEWSEEPCLAKQSADIFPNSVYVITMWDVN